MINRRSFIKTAAVSTVGLLSYQSIVKAFTPEPLKILSWYADPPEIRILKDGRKQVRQVGKILLSRICKPEDNTDVEWGMIENKLNEIGRELASEGLVYQGCETCFISKDKPELEFITGAEEIYNYIPLEDALSSKFSKDYVRIISSDWNYSSDYGNNPKIDFKYRIKLLNTNLNLFIDRIMKHENVIYGGCKGSLEFSGIDWANANSIMECWGSFESYPVV